METQKNNLVSPSVPVTDRDSYYKFVTLAFKRAVTSYFENEDVRIEIASDENGELIAFYKDLNYGYEFDFLVKPKFSFVDSLNCDDVNNEKWTAFNYEDRIIEMESLKASHEVSNDLFFNTSGFVWLDSCELPNGRRSLIQFGADKFIVDVICKAYATATPEDPYGEIVRGRVY